MTLRTLPFCLKLSIIKTRAGPLALKGVIKGHIHTLKIQIKYHLDSKCLLSLMLRPFHSQTRNSCPGARLQ